MVKLGKPTNKNNHNQNHEPTEVKRKRRTKLTREAGAATGSGVREFKSMGHPNDAAAMAMLRKVAALVLPLMTKRGWVLPLLREFVPDNPNLLGVNVNRGQEIRLRLRPHGSDSFYDLEFVIGTMLHELTHNIRGPHDAEFYKNLDLLTKEYEENLAKGWKGVGFDSEGERLGQGVSHNVWEDEARAIALRAAEQRARLNKIMIPSGGRKLGGNESDLAGLEKVLTPMQMAAMAAEQRMKDRIWCGSAEDAASSSSGRSSSTSSSSSCAHVHEISDDSESDKEAKVVILSKRSKGTNHKSAASVSGVSSPDTRTKPCASSSWECALCTFINVDSVIWCEACMTRRDCPLEPIEATVLENPESTTKIWVCEACSLHNYINLDTCAACERPSPSFLATVS
ncbi:WLM domain-containing protein [Chytriomyces sp. MP71]|nr:WLM domain-containing protein [Chytriomyces sp. MP71]